MSWSPSESDAKTLTGKDLTAEDLAKALAIIEVYIGVYEEQYPNLYGQDARAIKRGIAWQAAWMVERPDMFDRDDLLSFNQDGQGATGSKTWNLLAPLARMALARLSWRGSKSTSVSLSSTTTDPDDRLPWEPIR